MLIATKIEKDFGTAPGEPIFGDDVQRFLLVELEDPLLVGSGEGSGDSEFDSGPGWTSVTLTDDETGETRTIVFGFPTIIGSGSSSGIDEALLDFIQSSLPANDNMRRKIVSVWLVDETGRNLGLLGRETIWFPRVGDSTFVIPYDTVPGPFLGMTGTTQTNEPGWGGHAISRDLLPVGEGRRYSFDPKANVPFFSGIADESDIPTIRPSKYLVAFEVFGFEARIWYRNSVVVDTFPWTAGDRFHIIHSPERVSALVNSTLKWSS